MTPQQRISALVPFGSTVSSALDRAAAFERKWNTPEGRQEILNEIAIMLGGTGLGALGGGLASIPLGGAGAAGGKRIAEAIGPSLGASGAPERTAGEELLELSKTAATDVAANVVGRGAFRAAQPETWRNLARKPFTPKDSLTVAGKTTPRAELNKVADELGIDMTLAARSGRPTPRFVESALSIMPSSVDTIHGAVGKSISDINEKGLGDIADLIFPEALSPEAIADIAVNRLGKKQAALAGKLTQMAGRAPSRAAAGEAYLGARGEALDDLSALGKQLYDENPILAMHWDTPVDMLNAGAAARDAIEKHLSPDEIRNLLPAQATRTMSAIGALRPVEAIEGPPGLSPEAFAKGLGGNVEDVPSHLWERFGFSTVTENPSMTLRQLKELRTALMERYRALGPNSPAGAKVALSQAIDSLNGAVRGSGLPQSVVKEWFRVGKVYGAAKDRLVEPPTRAAKTGNKMAGASAGKEPEQIIDAVVRPGSEIGDKGLHDALAAAGHKPQLDKFAQGVIGEKYVDPATREAAGQRFPSPKGLAKQREKMGPGVEHELFHRRGEETPEILGRGSSSAMQKAEAAAFDDPRAKDITRYAERQLPADSLLSRSLAPMENPRKFEESIGFMGPEGPKLRRAFFDEALERSHRRDNSLSVNRDVSPVALEKMLDAHPQSFDVAVGQEQAGKLRDVAALGVMAKETDLLRGNTSRTTPAGAALQQAREIASAIPKSVRLLSAGAAAGAAGGFAGLDPMASAVAGLGVPWAAARAYANPARARFLTSAPEAVAPGGRMAGALGRAALGVPYMLRPPAGGPPQMLRQRDIPDLPPSLFRDARPALEADGLPAVPPGFFAPRPRLDADGLPPPVPGMFDDDLPPPVPGMFDDVDGRERIRQLVGY